MPKLIIVCGLPGSGKSTLARELSKQLNIACLHKDTLKENLFELLELSTPEESKRMGVQAIKLLLILAEEQLKDGADIIIESPFNYAADYALFTEWAGRYHTDIFSIVCKIPAGIRKDRFLNRPRHQSHFDSEASFDANFGGDDKEAVYEKLPGKKLYLTTDQPVATLAEKTVKFIKER